MISVARGLIILGLILIVIGGGVYLVSRTGFPLGSSPGNIRFQGDNLTCIVPMAASLILSIILTILLNLTVRMLR